MNCELCEGTCIVVEEDIECLCDTGFQLSSDGYSCLTSEGNSPVHIGLGQMNYLGSCTSGVCLFLLLPAKMIPVQKIKD